MQPHCWVPPFVLLDSNRQRSSPLSVSDSVRVYVGCGSWHAGNIFSATILQGNKIVLQYKAKPTLPLPIQRPQASRPDRATGHRQTRQTDRADKVNLLAPTWRQQCGLKKESTPSDGVEENHHKHERLTRCIAVGWVGQDISPFLFFLLLLLWEYSDNRLHPFADW